MSGELAKGSAGPCCHQPLHLFLFKHMPEAWNPKLLVRKLSDFCQVRVAPMLPPHEAERVRSYMVALVINCRHPPKRKRGYDWDEIAVQCAIPYELIIGARKAIEPGFDAIVRGLKNAPKRRTITIAQSALPLMEVAAPARSKGPTVKLRPFPL